MPIYQTDDYTLLQIKEKKFIDKFRPKLNKTWIIHAQMETNIHRYIYIYTHPKKSLDTFTHTQRKNSNQWNQNQSNTHTHTRTHTQRIKYQKQKRGKVDLGNHTLRKREEWPSLKKKNNQLKTIRTADTSEFKSHWIPH